MEKAGAGGRPKAVDMWEHVTVLEGKRVRCKHCGFEFAASANRIKAHINQIKGQGIRLCPGSPQPNNTNSNKVTSDLNEKEDFLLVIDDFFPQEDLLHPQGARNETLLLDCYMSSKHTEAIHQEGIHVGPSSVSHMMNEADLRLIQYVFEQSRSDETIFSSPRLHLKQSEFTTLRPETYLDSWVIDIFVYILTEIERNRSKPLNCYVPVIFSNKALQSDVSSFLKFVERHNMRENYMFDLKYCEKVLSIYIIPVHVEKNRCGHFYLYIIHVEDQVVEIWDSLRDQFMDKTEREQITKKILLVMETLFEDVMSTKFHWRMASNIQSQSNGYDCGVFVIKYMQQLDNYVRQNPSFQFDSNKERLDLALELLNSDFNQEREILSHKATGSYAQVHSEEDIDSCGIKRKQVDTCKTIFGGGKGAYVELDDFNDRVKRKKC
ncbi:putative ubiquitin-like-specific protease 1B [Prosopis cineraria]|uniref:putative ubiquitin-like-specific protease 1B n=1 Tax=Prosopis cineraria TaxID=364024 RepID=UPI00240F5A1D|nr:putative ubiquitin-like-specific protease 1B [Prosopis cineraria]